MDGLSIAALSANAVMLIAIITLLKLLWGMRQGAAKAARAVAAGTVAAVQTVKTADPESSLVEPFSVPESNPVKVCRVSDPHSGVHECKDCGLLIVLSEPCDR